MEIKFFSDLKNGDIITNGEWENIKKEKVLINYYIYTNRTPEYIFVHMTKKPGTDGLNIRVKEIRYEG